RSFAYIDDWNVLYRRECGSPAQRNRVNSEDGEHRAAHFRGADLVGSCGYHFGSALGPRVRNGEAFSVNAVGPSSGEGLHSPLHGVLHGKSAGDAAPDLVRQMAEVGF